MVKLSLKPLLNEPGLLINLENKKIMCLADLHLGIEVEFFQKGISLVSQNEKILEKTLKIINKEKIDELILLGDVKHNIPLNTVIEYVDVPKFLKKIRELTEVTIVPGNHDTGLKSLLPKDITLEKASGILRGNKIKIGFIHGHKKPKIDLLKSEIIILAHTHPAIKFIDNLFNSFKEPVWVLNRISIDHLSHLYSEEEFCDMENKLIKLIVMPAYNPLISGSPVNSRKEDPFLGPLLKNSVIDIKNSDIYLLDGTYLGKLSDIDVVDDFYLNDDFKVKKKAAYFYR